VVSAIAKEGRWMIKLKPLKAGGPESLTIAGDNTLVFTNVLVGEVWLCSGQSNMRFQLYRAENAEQAMAAANDAQLHLFSVPAEAVDEPQNDVSGIWSECTSQTVSNFSAVAYFFGRDIRRARKVPVGLIESSVGGTPAEAWTSRAALEADPEMKKILEKYADDLKAFDPAKAKAEHSKQVEKYQAAVKKAEANGTKPPAAPKPVNNPARSSRRPAGLYNAMIAPLQPFAIKGVIWYQGEANKSRAEQYKKLFPTLIQNWRAAWGEGDFPFLFAQIAPFQLSTAEIREAELQTWQLVPRTAMASTIDVGEATNIHPVKKEPVGARLALAARAIAYGEKIEYSGPVFSGMKIKDHRAELSFKHVGSGLVAKDGALKGFMVAGADGNFVPADAVIKGDKVLVSADSVSKPVSVRYGWAKVPDVNFYNREGLPANPFRTNSQ
jgi:sialate O-acetylesterase